MTQLIQGSTQPTTGYSTFAESRTPVQENTNNTAQAAVQNIHELYKNSIFNSETPDSIYNYTGRINQDGTLEEATGLQYLFNWVEKITDKLSLSTNQNSKRFIVRLADQALKQFGGNVTSSFQQNTNTNKMIKNISKEYNSIDVGKTKTYISKRASKLIQEFEKLENQSKIDVNKKSYTSKSTFTRNYTTVATGEPYFDGEPLAYKEAFNDRFNTSATKLVIGGSEVNGKDKLIHEIDSATKLETDAMAKALGGVNFSGADLRHILGNVQSLSRIEVAIALLQDSIPNNFSADGIRLKEQAEGRQISMDLIEKEDGSSKIRVTLSETRNWVHGAEAESLDKGVNITATVEINSDLTLTSSYDIQSF